MQEEDLTEQEALRRAQSIGAAVESLARELEVPDFRLATPESYEDIAQFRERVKTETDGLWAKAPDVARQEALAKEQQKLANLKGKHDAAKQNETGAHLAIGEFVRQHGDATGLGTAVDEQRRKVLELDEQIRQRNTRARLVKEATTYLKGLTSDVGGGRCPLCGAQAPDLLAHLEDEWTQEIQKQVEDLEQQRSLDQSEVTRLGSLRSDLATLEPELRKAQSALEECIAEIAAGLGREIGAADDPGALINGRLQQIKSELQSAEAAITEKLRRRTGIYDQLAKLRTIDEILRYQRKREAIEHIWETAEFAKLDALRDQASQLEEDVRAVRGCMAAASREEAQARIDTAGAALGKYFSRLTKHPAITDMTMEVTEDTRGGLNSYIFRSKDGSDPTPILSLGDLNCLALSLFLGLADAMGETQPFAFLIMDDPTQGLGPEMKQQLVSVLEGIADSRKLIISTPDSEFRDLLLANITKSKVVYQFLNWNQERGPEVSRAS